MSSYRTITVMSLRYRDENATHADPARLAALT